VCVLISKFPSHWLMIHSRFGLYSSSVRTLALKPILRQIVDGHTIQLTQSLLEWPYDEVTLFFSELSMCMDPEWTGFVIFIFAVLSQ
jgi:hypothetical protein